MRTIPQGPSNANAKATPMSMPGRHSKRMNPPSSPLRFKTQSYTEPVDTALSDDDDTLRVDKPANSLPSLPDVPEYTVVARS
jgi:hypothetical protein